MYLGVICVLYFIIIGMFAVCMFALRKWGGKLHTYLFFSCVANIVYNVGYLLQLHARDQASYIPALKMGYLGRMWIGFAMVLFIAQLSGVEVPKIPKTIAVVLHLIIYATILNLESNDLYYNYMEFTMDGDFPELLHSGGPLYYVLTAMNLIYVFSGTYLIIRTYRRAKNEVARKRYFLMIIAVISLGATYIIYFFKLIPLARKFDVMIVGYAIFTVFMLVAIIKYKMLDATEVAKNYLVDELSEALIVVDTEGRLTYFNKPAMKLFPELNFMKTGDGAADLVERFTKTIESREPVKLDGRMFTPKADKLTEGGTDVGTIYSLTDDSDHYMYMQALREQKKIADKANEAKSQFLANMSHEIRTPINAVIGLNEMISRECDKISENAENKGPYTRESVRNISTCTEDIKNAGSNLLTIINGVLDFSKIEAGKMDIVEGPYTLSSLLKDTYNMVSFRIEDKGLEFVTDVDEELPDALYGDSFRIKQVITNILTNAVKYTDSGSVNMTVRGRAEGGVMETGRMMDLIVEVRDTGIGIRHEDMDRLFDSFQRLELDRNSTVEGTGLGLVISKKLLRMMGGRISVKSEYGEGSTFTITVPQKILSMEPVGDFRERSAGRKKAYKVSFKAPDARILIVDDTRVNLTVAKGLLKDTNIQIDTASSGNEAIKLAGERAYDLILMDQRMPNMDGTEALGFIRMQKEGSNNDTPIICMTADAIVGARDRYIEEGFSDYLAKPIDTRELEQLLIKYLPEDKVI